MCHAGISNAEGNAAIQVSAVVHYTLELLHISRSHVQVALSVLGVCNIQFV